MTRLFLIRHGESVAQVEGFMSGHYTCRGLSDLGRRQVEALRDRLARTGEIQADVVLTSILPRAIETASIIAPAIGGGDAIQDCELCEIHIGEAEGLTWDEIRERYPRPDLPQDSYIPGAESWAQFNERVGTALRRYVEEHADRTIVAAVHGGIISASTSVLLEMPLGHGRLSPLANASITEWAYRVPEWGPRDEPRWQLVRYNDAAHLPDVG